MYDYFLTFQDEVDYMWNEKKGIGWCILEGRRKRSLNHFRSRGNRYFALAFCIITLSVYFLPSWTYEVSSIVHSPSEIELKDPPSGSATFRCNRFAIVEWLQALVIVVTAEAVLLIRIYALTSHRQIVLVLSFFIVGQIAVVFIAMLEPHQNGGKSISRTKVYVKTLAALELPDIPIDPFHISILYSDPSILLPVLTLF
ncbi:hypothetical protein L218DRAFT_992412 [Marasmius fiardii PR-910]|nr:hypothetical protein L218DRAFT_992412 [Marasmius fiardii PR-910]